MRSSSPSGLIWRTRLLPRLGGTWKFIDTMTSTDNIVLMWIAPTTFQKQASPLQSLIHGSMMTRCLKRKCWVDEFMTDYACEYCQRLRSGGKNISSYHSFLYFCGSSNFLFRTLYYWDSWYMSNQTVSCMLFFFWMM